MSEIASLKLEISKLKSGICYLTCATINLDLPVDVCKKHQA